MLRKLFGKRKSVIVVVKRAQRADIGALAAAAADWASVDEEVDGSGSTALMWACAFGQLEAVQWLLGNGASVSVTDKHEQAALHYVAKTVDSVDVLTVLLQAGAAINRRDELGRTVLHAAARAGHRKQVHALVNAPGVDLRVADHSGQLQMHLTQDTEIKVLFVMKRPEQRARRDSSQDELFLPPPAPVPATPMLAAAAIGDVAALRTAIAAGLSVNDVRDEEGCTPLLAAAAGGHVACVRLLLELGAAVNATDAKGCTALHKAFGFRSEGDSGVIDALVAAGADVNAEDAYGDTPLSLGAFWGKTPQVTQLLALASSGRFKLDFSASRNQGKSAEMWACEKQHFSLSSLILDAKVRWPVLMSCACVSNVPAMCRLACCYTVAP
jgi:ankyrin repeat protein